MKKIMVMLVSALMFCGLFSTAVCAAGPKEPVINSQMPDCSLELGSGGVTLFTDAFSPDGGTLEYQWYSSDVGEMSCIRAIDGAEGTSYQVPESLGVKWYCYAVWNNSPGGLKSSPVYSRLICVEFYESEECWIEILNTPDKVEYISGERLDLTGLKVRVYTSDGFFDSQNGDKLEITKAPLTTVGEQKIKVVYGDAFDIFIVTVKEAPHTHTFSDWIITEKPTCTKTGIEVRECDCGYTERETVPAAGHHWDAGKITKKPAKGADGIKTFTCTVCGQIKTEPVKAVNSSPAKPADSKSDSSDGTPESGGSKSDSSDGTPESGSSKSDSSGSSEKPSGSITEKSEASSTSDENSGTEKKELSEKPIFSLIPGWAIAVIIAVAAAGAAAAVLIVLWMKKKNGHNGQ